MNKRLVTLLAAVSALAGATAASAADLPARSRSYAAPVTPVAAFSWTGFYIGANVGYGWGNTTGTAANATNAALGVPAVGNFDLDGAFGGVQGGYNWQFNNWVVGIEADYQWASIDGRQSVGIATDSAKLDRFGTVRGRIGYAWDRWLVYGTGGYAFEGNMRYSFVAPAAVAASSRQGLDGYALGGGVEYAFAPNWSAKLEYLHVSLDDKAAPPLCAGACTAGADIDTVRFGLNYKFGGGMMGWR